VESVDASIVSVDQLCGGSLSDLTLANKEESLVFQLHTSSGHIKSERASPARPSPAVRANTASCITRRPSPAQSPIRARESDLSQYPRKTTPVLLAHQAARSHEVEPTPMDVDEEDEPVKAEAEGETVDSEDE
jgi:hypothetical protein